MGRTIVVAIRGSSHQPLWKDEQTIGSSSQIKFCRANPENSYIAVSETLNRLFYLASAD
jgi:hypothetical protein